MLRRSLIPFLTLLWSAPSEAQLHPSVFIMSSYSDNIYGTAARQSDLMTNTFVNLDVDLPAYGTLYYTGSASVFDENDDLFSHTHSVGAGYVPLVTESGALWLDAEVSTWLDHPNYGHYDYVQGDVRLQWVQLQPSWHPDVGYTLRYRAYPRASGYGFVEHLLSGTAEQSLAGFVAELDGDLGLRRYSSEIADPSDPPEDGNQSYVQLALSAEARRELSTDTSLRIRYRWLQDVLGRGADPYEEGDSIAIMAVREGLEFESAIESDSACVADMVLNLLQAGIDVHCLRDLTRGGLASALVEIAAAARLPIEIDETSIPVSDQVRGACEILGLDPHYVANEGRFIAFVPPDQVDAALQIIKSHPHGGQASRIGEVGQSKSGIVSARSPLRTCHIIDRLGGEHLPRIC